MKRPRSSSYGDDCHDEKLSFEDWPWRDRDPDRSSSSSSHRRPSYPKTEGMRKVSSSSSSYGRPLDDDGEPSRLLRRRYDHEPDHFDWRKGYDRYRDGGDRLTQALSPRGSYGSTPMHRSESISALRREFPKGFRSERDRPRREGNGGSPWRRSRSSKELAAGEVPKSSSIDWDSVGRRSDAPSPDDHRGKVRSGDSSCMEQSMKVETRAAEPSKESGSSSEMEEGELEPDPEPEAETLAEPSCNGKAATVLESENCKDRDPEYNNLLEEDFAKTEMLSDGKNLEVNGNDAVDENEESKLRDAVIDVGNVTDEARNEHDPSDFVKEMDGNRREEGGKAKDANGDNEVEDKFCRKKQEVCEEDSLSSWFQGEELEGNDEEQAAEEEAKEMTSSISTLQEEKLIENKEEVQCDEAKIEVEQKQDTGIGQGMEAEVKIQRKHKTGIELEVEQKEQSGGDIKTEPEGAVSFVDQNKEVTEPEGAVSLFDQNVEVTCETNNEVVSLMLMRDQTKEKYKDKGKSLAMSLSTKEDPVEDDDAMEGPSGKGFKLVFRFDTNQQEKARSCLSVACHHEDNKLKIEPLDLSLALPGGVSDHSLKHSMPKPEIPSCVRSIQSLPSSFRMNSDGFTTSISFTNCQRFVHNPNCSLTQHSLDIYDHLVGSHSISQGVDKVSSGTIWKAQTSNDSRRKGSVPLLQSVLLNGNSSHNSHNIMNDQHQSKPNGLFLQSSLSRQMSLTNSHGSHGTRFQQSKDKMLLTGERSSSSLFSTEQRDGEQFVLNGSSVMEKIVSNIVAEPLHHNGRMLQEMTDHSIACLRETISEMLTNTGKSRKLHVLQEALRKRSDMMMDTLTNCPRVLLEILVAIKMGLPDFLWRTNNLSSSNLAEIFLNLKCQNLACWSSLPVDGCDCSVCIDRPGFCSACMCLVCYKFDNASNTCSWVGCDVCLHWCHTDCGLRDSHIRHGHIALGEGITEMQFHCVACGHPSEMFGFVKEVFKTCAKDWKAETLTKELQYVRRIFSASNDVRGKRLHDLADQMLLNLEKKANHSEVVSHILAFLSDSGSNISSSLFLFTPKESTRNEAGQSNAISCSSKVWLRSVPSEKAYLLEHTGLISSTGCDQVSRKGRDIELQMNLEKKPVVDELERIVKFKQAEAKMYQERADDARKEAEGLKHIAKAKSSKIDEDYTSRIEKLRLGEAEERHRQKLKELQAIERTLQEYCNMKMRMEADIKDLLLKMEATRRNLNT